MKSINVKEELLKEIKLCGLKLSIHSRERMLQRGYTQKDIARVLLTGMVIKEKSDKFGWEITILGKDVGNSPCIAIFGRRYAYSKEINLVTIMPPVATKYQSLITKLYENVA